MLPGLRFVIAAIFATLVVAILGLGAVVSLRMPALFPTGEPKARDALADWARPSQPAWNRADGTGAAHGPLVIEIPHHAAGTDAAARQQAVTKNSVPNAANDTTGTIGGAARGRDLADHDRGAAATEVPAKKLTVASGPAAPGPLEPTSDAPSAALLIGERPALPLAMERQSRPLRPEFIAQPSMPEPVEVAAATGPRLAVAPIAVPLPLATETRAIGGPAVPIPPASYLPVAPPSPANAFAAPEAAIPVTAAPAHSAVTAPDRALPDIGKAEVANSDAAIAERASVAEPVKPTPAALEHFEAKHEPARRPDMRRNKEIKRVHVATRNNGALVDGSDEAVTAPSPYRDDAPTELAASHPGATSVATEKAGSETTATPELTPKHDTLASVAAPDLPAIPALPGPTRAPELAAGAASKPVPADTTVIAAKPPEPGTVEAVTPALTPDIASTGPPSAPILIKDVPLPRASPRRGALADANAPNATKPTAAKPVVRQRRARRPAQSRQQAPRDGLADLFFGGGKPQQER